MALLSCSLFSLLKNCDTMKRKYFNDSSICWRIIGETRYEEEVGMLEKWESVKGTIKTMGKELSAAFDWAFDRLFSRIQLTNEQFVYVLLSVPSCGCKSFKAFRSPQPNGQRLCTRPRHRLIRFLIQLGSWPMEISSIMIWSI